MNVKLSKKYIPYICMAASFIVILIRGFYSFCWSDETLYFSTADRFFKGDAIFTYEWFPTQLSSVCILPLYSLFVKITGSVTGVILFFRIVYAVLQLVFAVIIYNLLKDIHGSLVSLTISLFTMFYTHLNIATTSYYTMSVMFYLLAMVLIYSFYKKDDRRKLVFAGICFAISVLNLPTLAVVYVLIAVCGFILHFGAKLLHFDGNETLKSLQLPKIFIFTLTGILIPAVIFMIYMLTHISISDFLKALPYVLSDEEHGMSAIYPIKKMYLAIIESYGSKIFYAGCLLAVLCVASWLLSILNKYIKIWFKQDLETQTKVKMDDSNVLDSVLRIFNICLFVLDVAVFVLYLYKSFGHTGYIQTALMMFTLPLYFITKKKDLHAFILFFLSGIAFSLTYSYSSNGMLYVLSMGHFIASAGGLIFIKNFVDELKDNADLPGSIYARAVTYAVSAVVIISLIHTAYCRIANVYRDDKLSNLTAVIDSGPAKGLRTSETHKEWYDDVYYVLMLYCQSENLIDYDSGNILISRLLPWGYMCTDLRAAAPTTWRNSMDNERIMEYYEIHPERKPDMILVMDDFYGSYETCGDVEYDPVPNENAEIGCMYDFINKNNYKCIDVKCGKLYKKPD